MLLYNWKRMYRCSKGNPTLCVKMFRFIHAKDYPKNKFDPFVKFVDVDFSGESFIRNPKDLYNESFRSKHRDIAIYLALASIRNLGHYLTTGDTTISVDDSPVGNPQDKMINETLIYEENGRLHFLYED